MRKSASWMTIWDDRILELIQEEDSGAATELSKSDYIRVSRPHVSRRLKKLADHGLLQHLGNGVYIITDEGEEYLNGDLDTGELENVSEDNEGTASA